MLIAGEGASVDMWAPSFIDALAADHRVLVFDNEGVGRTTQRPGPLTIDRMADDGAAFIAALKLERPDVLGWSLGGAIAQALAIRHPASVRRMILCATRTGDGTALPAGALHRGPPFANFFPAGHDTTRRAFIRDIHRYHDFYLSSGPVGIVEFLAGEAWTLGDDPTVCSSSGCRETRTRQTCTGSAFLFVRKLHISASRDGFGLVILISK